MIWDDGRSGIVGCIAGSLSVEHLAESAGPIHKAKGTVFESPTTFLIGRVCSSDSYLAAPLVHWANASWDQHRQLEADAQAVGKSLHYLFITATSDPLTIRFWNVPADIVAIVFADRARNRPGTTCAIHIIADKDRQLLGRTDITKYQSALTLDSADAKRLTNAFRNLEISSQPSRQPVPSRPLHRPSANSSRITQPSASYNIPVSGGRSVTLEVPGPLSNADVLRVKSWLDVTADVLTESFDADHIPEQRRWLRDQVDAGLAQLDRGEKIDGETAFDRLLNSRRTGQNGA